MALSRESSSSNPQFSRIDLYEKGALLGSGANDAVYLCTNRVSKRKYACKVVPKFNFYPRQQEKVQYEIDVLFDIKHMKRKNLISIHEVIEDEMYWYIVMELCGGGTLSTHLENGRKFTEFEAAKIIKETMIGISACHKKGIVHRDMKIDNVVYESNLTNSKVKLIDFGNSAYYNGDKPLSGLYGSKIFSAPEMLDGHYGPNVDIWSVGVILVTLLLGHFPWTDEGYSSEPEFFLFENPPWPTISTGAKNLISKMLEVDVNKRLNATQVLKHPWIKQMSKLM